jgi:hypothetical protein
MTASDFRGFLPTVVFVASYWIASAMGPTLEASIIALAGSFFAAVTVRRLAPSYPDRFQKHIGWVSFAFAFMGVVPLVLYSLGRYFAD